MKATTVLYVMFLAGAFTGAGAYLRVLVMRRREPR